MTGTARTPLALALFGLLAAVPAPASAQDGSPDAPAWQDELTRQMFAEHDCLVDFYLRIEESERSGTPVVRARVHCEDQRLFDASRVGDSGPFMIERCATDGSRAC